MHSKKLSIVVLVCDKDKHLIPKLFKQIQNKVKIPYELILISNCTEPFRPEGDYKYFAFGYNAYQVQARKKGVKLASGDYIWFVDADDEVLPVHESDAELMEKDYDTIVFNLEKVRRQSSPKVDREFTITGDFTQEPVIRAVGAVLWNKWIRTKILRKIEAIIPRRIKACAMEDNLLVVGALFYSRKIRFTKRIVYRYSYANSYVSRQRIDNVDIFKKTTNGYLETRNLILKHFLKKSPKAALSFKSAVWYLSRSLFAVSPKILDECIDVFLKDCVEDIETLILDYRRLFANSYHRRPVQFHWLEASLKNKIPEHAKDWDIENLLKIPQIFSPEREAIINPLNYTTSNVWTILALEHSMGTLDNIKFENLECDQTKTVL